MTQEHPITPPPELVEQWEAETAHTTKDETWHVAIQAARWGADQELEACCEWVGAISGKYGPRLRLARRPKPPSLKEQALAELNLTTDSDGAELSQTQVELIRSALESLPE